MKDFFEIQLEIESKCLLDCKHCSATSLTSSVDKKIGYTLDNINKVLELIEAPIYLNLTGGEPLISDNYLQTIREFKATKKEISLGIFSCGVVKKNGQFAGITLDEAIKQKEMGLSSCYVSVYSHMRSKHEYITNLEGSFKYTVKTIVNFIEAGIDVKIHLVINSENIRNLESTINYLSELGVSEIRILRIVKAGNASLNCKDIGVSPQRQNQKIDQILLEKNNYKSDITFSGFPSMMACRPFNEALKCQAGTNLLFITYSGDVYPCACTRGKEKYKIAHISDLNLIEHYLNTNKQGYNQECLNSITT